MIPLFRLRGPPGASRMPASARLRAFGPDAARPRARCPEARARPGKVKGEAIRIFGCSRRPCRLIMSPGRRRWWSLVRYGRRDVRGDVGALAEDLTRTNLANSLVTLGQGAIKAALLINGASAVAILAFVGQVWSKELPTGVLASAKCAIAIFALGVAVAAFSTLFAYLAQLFYYRATGKEFDERVETCRAEKIRHFALLLVFLSFIIFIVGIYQSLQMFSNYAISG